MLKQRHKQTNSKDITHNFEVKMWPLKRLQEISPKDIIAPAGEKMAKNYNTVLCPNWFGISVYSFP